MLILFWLLQFYNKKNCLKLNNDSNNAKLHNNIENGKVGLDTSQRTKYITKRAMNFYGYKKFIIAQLYTFCKETLKFAGGIKSIQHKS